MHAMHVPAGLAQTSWLRLHCMQPHFLHPAAMHSSAAARKCSAFLFTSAGPDTVCQTGNPVLPPPAGIFLAALRTHVGACSLRGNEIDQASTPGSRCMYGSPISFPEGIKSSLLSRQNPLLIRGIDLATCKIPAAFWSGGDRSCGVGALEEVPPPQIFSQPGEIVSSKRGKRTANRVA